VVVTNGDPIFLYRTLLGHRLVNLPAPRQLSVDPGAWADIIHIDSPDTRYQLYMLKDGPTVDTAVPDLQEAVP
jgi:hypothetical protein